MPDNQHIEPQDEFQPENQPAPEPTSEDAPELFKKVNGDWAAADQSYWNIVNQRKELENKLNQQAQRAAELERILFLQQQGFNQPQQRPNPAQKIAEYGLPAEDITALVEQVAQAKAQELLGPLVKTAAAREQMLSQYPDFAANEAAAIGFVRADAHLSQVYDSMAASNPAAALEWAYTKHQLANAKAGPPQPKPLPQELQNSRAQAGLPGTSGRVPQPQTDRQKEIAQAAEYAKETRDIRPYVSALFKDVPLTWEEIQAARIAAAMKRGG